MRMPDSVLERAAHQATVGLRAVLDECRMLVGAFPLDDAFDADELPISFIMWRDAHDAEVSSGSPGSEPALRSTR